MATIVPDGSRIVKCTTFVPLPEGRIPAQLRDWKRNVCDPGFRELVIRYGICPSPIGILTHLNIDVNLYSMGSLHQNFAALADPTRLGIVAHLARREATVSELVAQFELTQPTITSHLNVLEQAGLISRTRVAQTRICRLQTEELERMGDWLGQLQSVFEGNYRRLDKLLQELNPTHSERKK